MLWGEPTFAGKARCTTCHVPLRGLMTHAKGGFYHDGRFADLAAVVDHDNDFFKLALSAGEKRDLIEYLKSL